MGVMGSGQGGSGGGGACVTCSVGSWRWPVLLGGGGGGRERDRGREVSVARQIVTHATADHDTGWCGRRGDRETRQFVGMLKWGSRKRSHSYSKLV